MPRYVHYAMEEDSLQAYIDHKNMIAGEQIKLSGAEIDRIKLELAEFKKNDRVLFTSEGDTAFMTISGVLEPKPDPCAIMFGFDMTTYQDIIEGIQAAEKDESILNLTLYFDTPGGNITGLFAACDFIRNTRLHTTGIVTGMAASAGFALISQCDTIKGVNQSIEVGSIGVRTDMVDRSEQEKRDGIVRHTLVSSNAPNKVNDLSKAEDRAKIVTRLTKLEGVFIDYVALGRNTTTDNVKSTFGAGGMLIADDALKVGMIDNIISVLPDTRKTTSIENNKPKIKTEEHMPDITMSEEDLKKLVSDSATAAASQVKIAMTAEIEERDAKASAETNRKAGFAPLLAKFPNQITMINEEIAKEGATANADFTIKLMDAETARLAAVDEQEDNSGDPVPPVKPDTKATADTEAEAKVSAMASQFGIDLTEVE